MNEESKKIILKIIKKDKNDDLKKAYLKLKENAETLGFKILLNEKDYNEDLLDIPSICSCGNLCNYKLNHSKKSDCYICNHGKCSYDEYKKYIEQIGYKLDISEDKYKGKSKRYPGHCPRNHECSLLVYNLRKGDTSCIKCGKIKSKETNLEKYGSENPMQNEEVKKKFRKTNLERYGHESPMQNEEVKKKTRKTNLEKYGSENPMQNEEVKNKTRETNLERYGHENPMQNEEVKNKTKETNLERYGHENPMQNEEVKNKTRETNLERYGYESPMQNEEVKKKFKETNLERYGHESPMQNEEVKKKTKETNLERYGHENPMQNEEVKKKFKETNLEKYGYGCSLQNEEVKNKSKETMLKRYEVEHPMQNEEIKKKTRETNLERYGFEYPMQNQEISNKQRKNSYCVKDYILPSGKEIKIQGYEGFCLDELFKEGYNENDLIIDIRYNKEDDIDHEMPEIWYENEGRKSRYFPDIFIPKEKRIIEIKSDYYLNLNLEKNMLKAEKCVEMGYFFEFRIYNRYGKLLNVIIV